MVSTLSGPAGVTVETRPPGHWLLFAVLMRSLLLEGFAGEQLGSSSTAPGVARYRAWRGRALRRRGLDVSMDTVPDQA